MTYVFDLEPVDYSRPPDSQLGGSDTASISFAVGYDLDDDTVAFMTVMLVSGESHMDAKYRGIRDLQFAVRTLDLATGGFFAAGFRFQERALLRTGRARVQGVQKYLDRDHDSDRS